MDASSAVPGTSAKAQSAKEDVDPEIQRWNVFRNATVRLLTMAPTKKSTGDF